MHTPTVCKVQCSRGTAEQLISCVRSFILVFYLGEESSQKITEAPTIQRQNKTKLLMQRDN